MRSIPEWIEARNTASSPSSSKRTDPNLNDTSESPVLDSSSHVESGTDYDSDDELDIEFTTKSLDLAREAFEKGNYSRVEEFLKHANPRFYHQLPAPVRETQVQSMLARAYFETGKLSDARILCDQLVACKINDDDDRRVVLTSSFLLSQIHLSDGKLDDSVTRCQQVIKGYKRLDPGCDAYLSALALMAVICKAQGNTSKSEICEAMLPATFKRPSFNMPSSSDVKDEAGRLPKTSKKDTSLDSTVKSGGLLSGLANTAAGYNVKDSGRDRILTTLTRSQAQERLYTCLKLNNYTKKEIKAFFQSLSPFLLAIAWVMPML